MKLANIPLILPAAGKSSRMGSPKGLQMRGPQTWLEIQCRAYAEIGGRVVVVVLGYDRERYLEALGCSLNGKTESFAFGGCSLNLLHNPLPEFGPFSSLQQAGRWIMNSTDYQAAFFLPMDTPVPSVAVFKELTMAMQNDINIAQPRYNDCGGHPVLLSREFLYEMTSLDCTLPGSRLDWQIRKLQEAGLVMSVPVTDARVVMNLNDPLAWEEYFEMAHL